MGTFGMLDWYAHLKERNGEGVPLRPSLMAVFADSLPSVPTVDGPQDEPIGEWRQVQHIDEVFDGCRITPMHLSWRAVARSR